MTPEWLVQRIHAALLPAADPEARAAGRRAAELVLALLSATPGEPLLSPSPRPAEVPPPQPLPDPLDLFLSKLTALLGTDEPTSAPRSRRIPLVKFTNA